MARILLSALCVFVLALPAQAARFSGDYLLQVCASDKDGKELSPGGHIACQAYISGILDYHSVMKSLGTLPGGVDFCVPETENLNQVQQKVLSHVYRNKHEQGPFIAAPAVTMALFNSYPCKVAKKKKN